MSDRYGSAVQSGGTAGATATSGDLAALDALRDYWRPGTDAEGRNVLIHNDSGVYTSDPDVNGARVAEWACADNWWR